MMKYTSVLCVFFLMLAVQGQINKCKQGEALNAVGNCIAVKYIEGCFRYEGIDTCRECEFNYRLTNNGKCNYNERDKKECCLKFSETGDCK